VSYLDPETASILPDALNLGQQHSQTKANGNMISSTLVQKNSLKNTIGGKTTAKKKTAFNYKETALNTSNFKANNKFATSTKFGYDDNILDRTSKVIIAPIPFNLESGIPESAQTGSNAIQLNSQHKVRGGGLKMQEKDFTIRKKKSRKEVEFLIGNRGVSENQTLQASYSIKETPNRNKDSREANGHSLSRISSKEYNESGKGGTNQKVRLKNITNHPKNGKQDGFAKFDSDKNGNGFQPCSSS